MSINIIKAWQLFQTKRTKYFWTTVLHLNRRQKSSLTKSAKNMTDVSVERIRNIGIMAHIDAGKTTTTERMLYFSGLTRHLGDVDDGDTVMDYMDQERDRGITITAAAISYHWNKHKINLIDTPGHVDFTLEVERSLRVLDGAITVLDASAGVEAQTLTVWKQANRYKIPRIIYLNKMDKPGASFIKSIHSVIDKLGALPLITQIPVGSDKNFTGLVDLVTLKKLTWDTSDGREYKICQLDKMVEPDLYEEAYDYRIKLIEQLTDLDDTIAHYVLNDLNYDDIPTVDLMNAIRKATLSQKGNPVLCGSSFKNKGVQPLMNAIVSFLPNPYERIYPFTEYYDSLCALAFKTVHDKHRGALTFLRLYSGSIISGSTIYNVNRDCTEKVTRLLQIYADEHKELSSASSGNIVAITGLKQTITGDTLVTSLQSAKSAKKIFSQEKELSEEDSIPPVLAGVEVPDPVFMCSIEPPSLALAKLLEHALHCLTKEDPSLRVSVDEDTGQTILSGMGELHLEIIKDRILKEYGVDVYMGPLYISYRETIISRTEEKYTLDKNVGNTRHRASVCLSIQPCEETDDFNGEKKVHINLHKDSELDKKRLRKNVLDAINNGVKSGLSRGTVLGFPVVNVRVELHDFTRSYSTSLPMVSACVALCISQALKKAGTILLQPMMSLQIYTNEDYLSSVLSDLSQRHSNIIDVQTENKYRTVLASTPLSNMVGYATALRTLSSGNATFTMQVSHYEQMDEYGQTKIIERATNGGMFS